MAVIDYIEEVILFGVRGKKGRRRDKVAACEDCSQNAGCDKTIGRGRKGEGLGGRGGGSTNENIALQIVEDTYH